MWAKREQTRPGRTKPSARLVSHRGSAFVEFAAQSEKNLRALLNVPENYKVLFLQGGATLQFAAVPLNLAPPGSVVA